MPDLSKNVPVLFTYSLHRCWKCAGTVRMSPVRPSVVVSRMEELSRHPNLRRWMVRHYDELVTEFGGVQPDWSAFVAALAEQGMARMDGSPFKPDTARKAWSRTVRNITRARSGKPELPYPAGVRPVALPDQQPSHPTVPAAAASPPSTSTQSDADNSSLAALRLQLQKRS